LVATLFPPLLSNFVSSVADNKGFIISWSNYCSVGLHDDTRAAIFVAARAATIVAARAPQLPPLSRAPLSDAAQRPMHRLN
jgi:hypothetical protein